MRAACAVGILLGATATAAAGDAHCDLASAHAGGEVTVTPAGGSPFTFTLMSSKVELHLGDGTIDVRAPLAFSATVAEPALHAARPIDLAHGIVHVEPGAMLRASSVTATGVLVAARLFGDGRLDVPELAVPCSSLAVGMPATEPKTPPHGDATKMWAPRGTSLTLRATPDGEASITLTLTDHALAFEELATRGKFRRLVFASGYGWVIGWAAVDDLVEAKPAHSSAGMLMSASPSVPAGAYHGPATVRAGTEVYASANGHDKWATVARDTVFDVIAAKDSEWVQLTGSMLPGQGRTVYFATGAPAWIRASAVAKQHR